MATQKFNFDVYFKCTLIWELSNKQSNKIVLTEIKDSKALPEPSYGKEQTFWPVQYIYAEPTDKDNSLGNAWCQGLGDMGKWGTVGTTVAT